MTKALWLTILMLATGLIAAGCGDDDDDGGDAPTKEEFIVQANQICSDSDVAFSDAFLKTFGQPDQPRSAVKEEQFATEVAIPNLEKQFDRIDELTPPEGDEDQIQQIVDSAREGIWRARRTRACSLVRRTRSRRLPRWPRTTASRPALHKRSTRFRRCGARLEPRSRRSSALDEAAVVKSHS